MIQLLIAALSVTAIPLVHFLLTAPSRAVERPLWIPTVAEVPFATFDTTGMF